MDIILNKHNYKENDIQEFLKKFFNVSTKFDIYYQDGKILAINDVNLAERFIVELRQYDAAFLHLVVDNSKDASEKQFSQAWRSFIYNSIEDPIEKKKYKAKAVSAMAQKVSTSQNNL